MADRVFMCLLIVLFSSKASSQKCTDQFCSYTGLYPCFQYPMDMHMIMHMEFTHDLSKCDKELPPGRAVAWRVKTSLIDSKSLASLTISVRQSSNGDTASWTLPALSETFEIETYNVSRTLCPALSKNGSDLSGVIVDVQSNYAGSDAVLQTSIEPVWKFELRLDNPFPFTLSGILSSQVYYFPFTNESLSLFSISSLDSSEGSQTCLIVSVQEALCPYEATLEKVKFESQYQTMGNSSTFIVERAQRSSDGIFIVFIPTAYDHCANSMNASSKAIDDYTKNITVTVTSLAPFIAVQHVFSMLLPVGVALALFLLSLCTISSCADCGWSWKCCKCQCHNCQHCKPGEMRIVTISLTTALHKNREDVRVVHLSQKEGLSSKYSTYCWYTMTVGIFYALPTLQAILYQRELLDTIGNQDLCYYNFKCAYPASNVLAANNVYSNLVYLLLGIMFKLFVFVRSKCLVRWKKKNKSVPAVVNRLDKISARLEELDECLNQHDVLPDEAQQEAQQEEKELACREKSALLQEKELLESQGLPEFNALYYAIGFALSMEGVMSGIYHVCPTDTNFQFDTAFMFVMGGLIIVKIMQIRHPDLHTHSYIVFFAFAVILILTFFGIHFNSYGIGVVIFAIMMFVIPLSVASLYIYHPPLWEGFSYCHCLKATIIQLYLFCSKIARHCGKKEYNNLKQEVTVEDPVVDADNRRNPPTLVCSKNRLLWTAFAVMVAFILNFVVFLYVTLEHDGVGMGFVSFIMFNLVALSLIYVVNKLRNCERWTLIPLMWGAIGLVSWGFALYFFLYHGVYNTEETPAHSQESNRECLPLTFYDYHDLWHILSAIALYSTASVVLSVDDGLVKTPINNIPAF